MATTTSVLSNRAMLVTLSISQPKLTMTDKAVTRKVLNDHGAQHDAAKVDKDLFGPDYQPIKTKVNEIRSFHYFHTSPWLDNGPRILATANFTVYSKGMREKFDELDGLIEKFLDHIDEVYDRQEKRLNGLFNRADYPSTSTLRSQFGRDVSYAPVPTAGDFRAEIDNIDLDYIKAALVDREESAIETIMEDAYQRLFDEVKHVAEKLSEPKAIFRDTMIENVRSLIKIMDGLNIKADPLLEELTKEVEQSIAPADPERLRKDEVFRSDVAEKADDIYNRMKAFM